MCLQNPKTAAAVRSMVKDKALSELQRCFGARMEFGTAGLRAAMGPGVSCMNDLTIIQTTQVMYCTQAFPFHLPIYLSLGIIKTSNYDIRSGSSSASHRSYRLEGVSRLYLAI